MKLHMHKRYCHKIGRYGGLGGVLQTAASIEAKEPDSHISIEYNERSTSHKYRVTRMSQFELEVPDPPDNADYPVPPYPTPAVLPEEEFEYEFTKTNNRWGGAAGTLTMRHVPTGIEGEDNVYYYSEQEGKAHYGRYLKQRLEQKIDKSYEARMSQYREASKARGDAWTAWEKEVAELVKQAG